MILENTRRKKKNKIQSPVLTSALANLGCPHMLQSFLRAQFTLPHLKAKKKKFHNKLKENKEPFHQ